MDLQVYVVRKKEDRRIVAVVIDHESIPDKELAKVIQVFLAQGCQADRMPFDEAAGHFDAAEQGYEAIEARGMGDELPLEYDDEEEAEEEAG